MGVENFKWNIHMYCSNRVIKSSSSNETPLFHNLFLEQSTQLTHFFYIFVFQFVDARPLSLPELDELICCTTK